VIRYVTLLLFNYICQNINLSSAPAPPSCPDGDKICATDKDGFEAIRQLHFSIDDDQDGNLDRFESDEVSISSA
jgi:hypothetical protein